MLESVRTGGKYSRLGTLPQQRPACLEQQLDFLALSKQHYETVKVETKLKKNNALVYSDANWPNPKPSQMPCIFKYMSITSARFPVESPMKKILLLLLLVSFCAQAEENAPAAKGSHVIEIILFHQEGQAGQGVATAIGPDASLAKAVLISPSEQSPDLLPDNSLQLSPIAYTLGKNGLDPMLHIAWWQSMRGWKSPDWRWIETDQIHGLVRVTRGKFLHLDTDLVYTDRATGRSWPIKLERKMRSNELHYVDHPLVGMLIHVRSAAGADQAGE